MELSDCSTKLSVSSDLPRQCGMGSLVLTNVPPQFTTDQVLNFCFSGANIVCIRNWLAKWKKTLILEEIVAQDSAGLTPLSAATTEYKPSRLIQSS